MFSMLYNSVETHFWHVSALLNLKLLLPCSLPLKPISSSQLGWQTTHNRGKKSETWKLSVQQTPQLLSLDKNHSKKVPTSKFIFPKHNRRPSRERAREREYKSPNAGTRSVCYWQSLERSQNDHSCQKDGCTGTIYLLTPYVLPKVLPLLTYISGPKE